MTSPRAWRIDDGVLAVRPPRPGEVELLEAARDPEATRWLGPVTRDFQPKAVIDVAGEPVGWVDFDTERDWLEPGAVNCGYFVLPQQRRRGYATRAVKLLVHWLALEGRFAVATLLIRRENEASRAVARAAGFTVARELDMNSLFSRSITPLPILAGPW